MSKEQLPVNVLEQIEKAKRELLITGAELVLGKFKYLSRIEVIDSNGRQYVKYFDNGCTVDFQDDSRTMKIFITPNPTE